METIEELYFKRNPHRKIIVEKRIDDFMKNLTQENPKQETIEEAAERYLENVNEKVHKDLERDSWIKIGFIAGAKWQAERMYSEEELIQKILDFRFISNTDTTRYEVTEWVKKFK